MIFVDRVPRLDVQQRQIVGGDQRADWPASLSSPASERLVAALKLFEQQAPHVVLDVSAKVSCAKRAAA